MQYSVNRPTVVYETIDGEMVVINLRSGAYYSLNSAATQIFEALDEGASLEMLVSKLGAGTVSGPEIREFVRQLEEENLLIPLGSIPGQRDAPGQDKKLATRLAACAAPPVLTKFTDMEEFLLLDPIHEVDESGWPNIKADDGASSSEQAEEPGSSAEPPRDNYRRDN